MPYLRTWMLTPTEILLRDVHISQAICPNKQGEWGVLPEHFPIIIDLDTGLFRMQLENSNKWIPFLIIGEGVAEMRRINKLVVLAPDIREITSADFVLLDKATKDLKEAIGKLEENPLNLEARYKMRYSRAIVRGLSLIS